MEKITINKIPFKYVAPKTKEVINYELREFFINDEPLSKILKIERNEKYADSDLGMFSEPVYNIEAFEGEEPPPNQFGTNRLVLYRCFCGCDYCGVVSCELEIKEDVVLWKNIGEEEDDEIKVILKEIKFDKSQYFKIFEALKGN